MIKIVVFDAFNTLVKRNKKYVIDAYKLVQERATKDCFNPMATNFSVREYAKAIGSVYSDEEMLDIEHKLDIEISKITQFEESMSVLEAVKKEGFKVVIGSNLAPAYGPILKTMFDQFVDEYYFSYEMGLAKPDEAFYKFIMYDCAAKYSATDPKEFYMVGDSYINDFKTPMSIGWWAAHLDRTGKIPHSISRLNSIFLDLNYRKYK